MPGVGRLQTFSPPHPATRGTDLEGKQGRDAVSRIQFNHFTGTAVSFAAKLYLLNTDRPVFSTCHRLLSTPWLKI
jgi:hypothetical protein